MKKKEKEVRVSPGVRLIGRARFAGQPPPLYPSVCAYLGVDRLGGDGGEVGGHVAGVVVRGGGIRVLQLLGCWFLGGGLIDEGVCVRT